MDKKLVLRDRDCNINNNKKFIVVKMHKYVQYTAVKTVCQVFTFEFQAIKEFEQFLLLKKDKICVTLNHGSLFPASNQY